MPRHLLLLLLALCLPEVLLAWGPQSHAYLGRAGARQAGLDEKGAELAASGALLADLDHALKRPAPVGDSASFSRAVAAVRGLSPLSDRFAAGWLAHAMAQDPGQGEISSQSLKLYADLILGRTRGQQIAGAVYDPERIRKATAALGGSPHSADDIRKAVEYYVLLGIIEGALVDMVPLELGEPDRPAKREGTRPARQEQLPEFDLAPAAASRAPAPLPTARSLMPPALANYERRLEESLTATAKLLAAPLPAAEAGVKPPAGGHSAAAVSRITLPPSRLIGITVTSKPTAGGLIRTTASLHSLILFKAAAGVMLGRMADDLFPSVQHRWDAKERINDRARALQQYLREEGARLRRLFPDQLLRKSR